MNFEYLKKIVMKAMALGCRIEWDASLKNRTTFRMGGRCNLLIHMNGEKSFLELIPLAEGLNVPYYIFGKGSNLIVDSDGISGIVFLSGGEFSTVFQKNDDTFVCQAGASLISICNKALEQGFSGLEFAYGIPGTLGGAVFMNAGAYGGEMKDVVFSVKAMDRRGNIKIYANSELDFSYRYSKFCQSGEIILSAEIKLQKVCRPEIRAKMNEFMEKRRSKQPLEFPSAGSMFKRPEGNYAAALIEQCGLKGLRVGDAEVSKKHSGFVINKGNASFAELIGLINIVKSTVKEKTGYTLECEPIIITDKRLD